MSLENAQFVTPPNPDELTVKRIEKLRPIPVSSQASTEASQAVTCIPESLTQTWPYYFANCPDFHILRFRRHVIALAPADAYGQVEAYGALLGTCGVLKGWIEQRLAERKAADNVAVRGREERDGAGEEGVAAMMAAAEAVEPVVCVAEGSTGGEDATTRMAAASAVEPVVGLAGGEEMESRESSVAVKSDAETRPMPIPIIVVERPDVGARRGEILSRDELAARRWVARKRFAERRRSFSSTEYEVPFAASTAHMTTYQIKEHHWRTILARVEQIEKVVRALREVAGYQVALQEYIDDLDAFDPGSELHMGLWGREIVWEPARKETADDALKDLGTMDAPAPGFERAFGEAFRTMERGV